MFEDLSFEQFWPLSVIIIGFMTWFIGYRNTRKTDVKAIARALLKEQEVMAEKLRQANEEDKKARKKEMEDHINSKMDDIHKDLRHEVELIGAKLEPIQKTTDMLAQFYYGEKVKSEWPGLVDEDESQAHNDLPGEGLFKPTQEERKDRRFYSITKPIKRLFNHKLTIFTIGKSKEAVTTRTPIFLKQNTPITLPTILKIIIHKIHSLIVTAYISTYSNYLRFCQWIDDDDLDKKF